MLNLTPLPTDLVRYIYLRWYFPSVIEELQKKVPPNNSFVVRGSFISENKGHQVRIYLPIVELLVPMGTLYIYPFITLELYREGVSSDPKELGRSYFSRLA
jgi:hypothetical protein